MYLFIYLYRPTFFCFILNNKCPVTQSRAVCLLVLPLMHNVIVSRDKIHPRSEILNTLDPLSKKKICNNASPKLLVLRKSNRATLKIVQKKVKIGIFPYLQSQNKIANNTVDFRKKKLILHVVYKMRKAVRIE